MKSGPSDRWEHLGALLIQRRTQLSPRFHNRGAFTESTGLSYRLIYDVEEARRANFGASTLAAIEAAYRLAPGAIARFLAGGELEVQGAPPRLTPADVDAALQRGPGDFPLFDAATQAVVGPHFEAVRALIKQAIMDGADLPVPKGAQVFRDAWEQQRWDRLVAAGLDIMPPGGYSLWELAMAMATGRARDDAARQQGRAAGLILMRG